VIDSTGAGGVGWLFTRGWIVQKIWFAVCVASLSIASSPASSNTIAFVDSGGILTTLTVPGATSYTEAFSINNSGQIVGDFATATGNSGFLYSGGVYTTINAPGATSTIPFGINNSGQVVGYYSGPGITTSGFLYSGGVFSKINIVAPPGPTWAYGINDMGQVVGTYGNSFFPNQGFLTNGTTVTSLNVPGAISTAALGTNNAGEVIGISGSGVGPSQSFLYDGSNYTTLSVPGALSTYATDINNLGVVLIQSDLGDYLFSEGNYTKVLPNRFEAFGINDLGQIVGRVEGGIPEPSTWAMLLIGFAGLVLLRRLLPDWLRPHGKDRRNSNSLSVLTLAN
jgi:probable HAF family extracellular repeat protein